MRLFKISTALRSELRLQRQTIFGNRRYWFHIAIWICITFVFIIGKDFTKGLHDGLINGKSIEQIPIFYGIIFGSGIAAIMVYFFLMLVIPYARHKRRKTFLWLGLMSNIGFWILTLILVGILSGAINPIDSDKSKGYLVGISASLSAIISAYFFSLYYFIDLYDQQKYLNNYQQVFTDKLHAETNFLKTQINPHFLFNTLNNIYSLSLKQSDNAVVITQQLKDLIQYMVNDCSKETVPLAGEIEFLKNYVALEQLRNKQENIDIELNIKGSAEGKEIAPLLLVNFIENAFKHGVKAGINHAFVRINLYIMSNILSMEIINSKPQTTNSHLSVQHSGGIGIKNVRRRLEILYPKKHKLRINESKEEYAVHLNITL